MRFFYFSLAIILVGCSAKKQPTSYKMISEAGDVIITKGFQGCSWKEHEFKTSRPISGTLKLNIVDCPSEEGMQPQYGFKRKYFLNDDNALMVLRRPYDRNFPDTKKPVGPYMKLHKIEGKPESFMQRFVNTDLDDNCIIRENSDGLWQIGFEKEYYEALGWHFPHFNSECPKIEEYLELAIQPKTEPCLTDDDFPILRSTSVCSYGDQSEIPNVYRISGPIVFEFNKRLLEPHPLDQAHIDKYSVEVVD